ncbi:MAG: hypothetical protein A2066_06750 [Bacteroidetes bacterium GWB2_41_8]|nr:MAG: hypothetical protein A2066_06750 [Bacteroidetes bacterium GWB2_41_8]
MKLFKTLSLVVIIGILFSSCAKIFYSPDAYNLARNHKTVAILPPTVSIAAGRKVDAEALKEQQKTESINFQKEMYSWMLKRKMQGKITPEIQDVETTNAKLKNAGFPEKAFTSDELCEILGVDGTLGSNYSLSKPMSQGAAIAVGVLFGAWGATNEVTVALDIKDCANKKLLWNYDHKFSGSIGSSPARLVDGLMRHASKKMPYVIN